MQALNAIHYKPQVLIMRLRHVPTIDASGIVALEDILEKCKRDSTQLLLCGVKSSVAVSLRKAGVLSRLPQDHVISTLEEAVSKAQELRQNIPVIKQKLPSSI